MVQTIVTWMLSHADQVTLWTGSFLLALIGRVTWRRDLLTRLAQAAGVSFWEIEQTLVAGFKAANADGHLTAAEAKLVFQAALAKARGLLSLKTAGRLLMAILGVNVDKWLTSHIETMAATASKAVAPKTTEASPLPLPAPR